MLLLKRKLIRLGAYSKAITLPKEFAKEEKEVLILPLKNAVLILKTDMSYDEIKKAMYEAHVKLTLIFET